MVSRRIAMSVLVAYVSVFGCLRLASAQRTPLSLDGTWSVGESVQPEEFPSSFDHRVAVPGLTKQAVPAFPDVDRYQTYEYILTMKNNGCFWQTTRPSRHCKSPRASRALRSWCKRDSRTTGRPASANCGKPGSATLSYRDVVVK